MEQEGTIRSKELARDTWCLEYSDGGSTSYVLKGEKRAILIDPGYGLRNGRAYAEKRIGMEIPWAADTHGHFDHAGGNEQFERVYMSAAGEGEAKTPYPSLQDQAYSFDYEITYVEDGSKIDLGGRTLEAFLVPSHSSGDVAWLDSRERILYVGDMAGYFVPLVHQVEEPQPGIQTYAGHLRKLLQRKADYDWICTGHGNELIPGEVLEQCLQNAEHILAGAEGEPYQVPEDPFRQPEHSWKWQGPRPGDFKVYQPEYKRVSRYAGITLEYDMRYIRK